MTRRILTILSLIGLLLSMGVSQSTLHRQVAKGKLRTVRIGKLVRFVGSDLLAYQRERGGKMTVLGDSEHAF